MLATVPLCDSPIVNRDIFLCSIADEEMLVTDENMREKCGKCWLLMKI